MRSLCPIFRSDIIKIGSQEQSVPHCNPIKIAGKGRPKKVRYSAAHEGKGWGKKRKCEEDVEAMVKKKAAKEI